MGAVAARRRAPTVHDMGGRDDAAERSTAAGVFLVLGLLVVAGAAWLGLSPISAEGHSCGSTWMREDKALDCYRYYDWSMAVSVAAVLIGLALCGVGVALLRRRRPAPNAGQSKVE